MLPFFESGLRSRRARPENILRLAAYIGLNLMPCDNAVLWVTLQLRNPTARKPRRAA